jgi:hypothetical protein
MVVDLTEEKGSKANQDSKGKTSSRSKQDQVRSKKDVQVAGCLQAGKKDRSGQAQKRKNEDETPKSG